jgi:hypothetical protein
MAWMNQEKKKELAPKIKEICKRRHHSTLVLNIKSGIIDFDLNEHGHKRVNEYHYEKHATGKALEFLSELVPAMNIGNYDRSNVQADYFDVGFYTDINIGKWDNPYVLTK